MQRVLLAGILSALCASVGASQTADTDPPEVLTEEQLLSALDASHPLVRAAAEEVGLSSARAAALARFDNPELGVMREDPAGSVEQLDALLSWKLPDAARGARIRAAEAEIRVAEYRFLAALADLEWRFRGAYADWALALEREQAFERSVARLQRLADREQLRVERGESAALDAARLRLVVADLAARREQSAAEAEEARALVAAWYPSLGEQVEPVRPSIGRAPSAGEAPVVLAAQAEVEVARAERRAAARFVASPELVLGWQRQESGTGSIDGPVVGLGWSVPLFKRNQGEQVAAEIRELSARARLETIEREQRQRVESLLRVRDRLEQAVATAERGRDEGLSVLDAAEAAFVAGESTTTDLLDTYQAHLEARLAQLELYGRLLAATRDLKRLAGPGDLAVDIDPSHLEAPKP